MIKIQYRVEVFNSLILLFLEMTYKLSAKRAHNQDDEYQKFPNLFYNVIIIFCCFIPRNYFYLKKNLIKKDKLILLQF